MKTGISRSRTLLITLCIMSVLALALVAGAAVANQDKTSTEPARITASSDVDTVSILTAEESQALSFAVGKVLRHADLARRAITDEKTDEAISQVDQGLLLLQIVEKAAPKRKVTTDIKAGDLAYHNEEDVALRFVSIYDEQYVEDVVMPVIQARQEGSTTEAEDMSKDQGTAKEIEIEPVEEANTAPLVDFSMWRHTSMKLDTVLAKDMLELAKKSLSDNKNIEADTALRTLQISGVSFELDSAELPLVEAADNLKLAELELFEGRHDNALATLKVAADDLKKYEVLAGENRAAEVRELHEAIDALTKSADESENMAETLEAVKEKVSEWWSTAVGWFRK